MPNINCPACDHYQWDLEATGGRGRRSCTVDYGPPIKTGGSTDTIVEYEFLGLGVPIKVSYPRAEVLLRHDLAPMTDDSSTLYEGLDRFGRVLNHMWVNDGFAPGTSGADPNLPHYWYHRYDYDADSNRLLAADERYEAFQHDDDWYYTYSGFDRLTRGYRGTLIGNDGDVPSSSGWDASDTDDWTLSEGSERFAYGTVGNWRNHWLDADTAWPVVWDTDEKMSLREHNYANEFTTIDTLVAGTGGLTGVPPSYTTSSPSYDANGNFLGDGGPIEYIYDAWNRLVKAESTVGMTTNTVGEYSYNGLGWRVSKLSDTAKGAYDGVLDQERRMYYSASWQLLEEQIDDSASSGWSGADRIAQQFWGNRYIDDAVARRVDDDADGDWVDAEATLKYYLTDAQFSVRSILDETTALVEERIGYSPYGVAEHRFGADLNGDGSVDNTDGSAFTTAYLAGEPKADLNFDGSYHDPTAHALMGALGRVSVGFLVIPCTQSAARWPALAARMTNLGSRLSLDRHPSM